MWIDSDPRRRAVIVVGADEQCDEFVQQYFGCNTLVELLERTARNRFPEAGNAENAGGYVEQTFFKEGETSSTHEQPNELEIRFVGVQELHTPSHELVETSVLRAVRTTERMRKTHEKRNFASLEPFRALGEQIARLPLPPEVGFLEQPLAFFFAACISSRDAVTSLTVLSERVLSGLPGAYPAGILDASQADRHYVLIRRPDDADIIVDKQLNAARAAFGARAVHLLDLKEPDLVQQNAWEQVTVPTESVALNSLSEPKENGAKSAHVETQEELSENKKKYLQPGTAEVCFRGISLPGVISCTTVSREGHPSLRILVEEFRKNLLTPLARDRASSLQQHFDRLRRGVRNTFKSFFRTADRNRAGVMFSNDENAPPQFLHNSNESQLRLWADTQFLLGDYVQALVNYKAVAEEARIMNALVVHGAAMEMSGYCTVLIGGDIEEAAECYLSAMELYIAANAWFLVIRVVVQLIRFYSARACVSEARTLCLHAVSVMPRVADGGRAEISYGCSSHLIALSMAVFLEMAAVCSSGTSFTSRLSESESTHEKVENSITRSMKGQQGRRASMFEFFAAENYAACGLHGHSVHCYRSSLRLIEGQRWQSLEDHLNWMIAQGEMQLDRVEGAYVHIARLLKASDSPPKTQLVIFNELFAILAHFNASRKIKMAEKPTRLDGPGVELRPLSFPLLLVGHSRLSTIDQQIPDLAEDYDWAHLENRAIQKVLRTYESEKPLYETLLPPPAGSPEHRAQRYQIPGRSVVGEKVFLHVKFSNPLRVAMYLFDIVPTVRLHRSSEECNDKLRENESQEIEVVPVRSVMLQALTTLSVVMAVRPLQPGMLFFEGVSWSFSNEAHGSVKCSGHAELWRRGRRLNNTRSERTNDTPIYADDTTLQLNVVEDLPFMSTKLSTAGGENIAIDGSSVLTLREGQMMPVDILLRNESKNKVIDRHAVRWEQSDLIFADEMVDTAAASEISFFESQNGGKSKPSKPSEKVLPEETDRFGDDLIELAQNSSRISSASNEPDSVEPNVHSLGDLEDCTRSNETEPRESVLSRLILRGALLGGPGRSAFRGEDSFVRAVLCYLCRRGNSSSAGEASKPEKSILRTLRILVHVRIQPSISAIPRFMRYKTLGSDVQYLLGIELERSETSDSEELALHSVEVFSRGIWTCHALEEASQLKNVNRRLTSEENIILFNDATATVFIRLKKGGSNDSSSADSPLLTSSRVRFYDRPHEIGSEDDGNFLAKMASLYFMREEHERAGNAALDADPEVAEVVVRWKSTSSDARGEVYLPPLLPVQWVEDELISMRSAGSLSNFRRKSLSHLKVKALHNDKVQWKPNDDAVAVPTDLIIENSSNEEFSPETRVILHPPQAVETSAGRYWSGQVETKVKNLGPRGHRRVRLQAIVLSEGCYNLLDARLSTVTHAALNESPNKAKDVLPEGDPSLVYVQRMERSEDSISQAEKNC